MKTDRGLQVGYGILNGFPGHPCFGGVVRFCSGLYLIQNARTIVFYSIVCALSRFIHTGAQTG